MKNETMTVFLKKVKFFLAHPVCYICYSTIYFSGSGNLVSRDPSTLSRDPPSLSRDPPHDIELTDVVVADVSDASLSPELVQGPDSVRSIEPDDTVG